MAGRECPNCGTNLASGFGTTGPDLGTGSDDTASGGSEEDGDAEAVDQPADQRGDTGDDGTETAAAGEIGFEQYRMLVAGVGVVAFVFGVAIGDDPFTENMFED